MDSQCDTHPEVASLANCSRCGRPFCDPCLPSLVDGLVACAGCAGMERAQVGRPWGFAGAVLVATGLGSFAFAKAELRASGEPSWFVYGLAALISIGFAGFVVSRKRAGLRVEPREVGEVSDEEARDAAGPYRQMARRTVVLRLPPVSGRLTAFTLLMCLVWSSLAAPFAMHLPRWVEAEIVLLVSWLAWAGVLAFVLHRGGRISDDHRFGPSLWFLKKKAASRAPAPQDSETKAANRKNKKDKKKKDKKSSGGGSWFDGLSGIGDLSGLGDAGEGCLFIVGAILLAGGAVLMAWLLVELVIPALFTLAYLLIIRALKLATNDDTCQGDLPRALGRGALFATLYLGPLFLLVVLVHMVARKSGVF